MERGQNLELWSGSEKERRSSKDNGRHGRTWTTYLTIGQYLQPTKMHIEVDDFITPEVFEMYKEEGLSRGLKYVESGPLVRSSYHAERHVNVEI